MAKLLTHDVIHLTLLVPSDLTTPESEAIEQTLSGVAFMADLRRTMRRLIRSRRPVLDKVRLRISR